MFKRLIQWFKKFFQALFGGNTAKQSSVYVEKKPAPPLNDTDLEFLFTELLEGVNQARGQAWALKWLHNIEHRVSTERWLEWLHKFGDKLLASSAPNNELAARLVQLGELEVGEVGDTAYDIGMQLLTRNNTEPVWEYSGPDSTDLMPDHSQETTPQQSEMTAEGEFQTITLEQLYEIMLTDANLRASVAQQVGIESDDPDIIIQALVEQFQAESQEAAPDS
ncbi:hypothetical protein NIES4071_70180 [Calothrix sp. NIES-4071]|nr:hypothetical protein NIES4071_70180 [Calothrix sp. NIES-4071]BAZ61293.1 hypothetical protein NIES4105_70130 [Calothrix sp. NIES-4105]